MLPLKEISRKEWQQFFVALCLTKKGLSVQQKNDASHYICALSACHTFIKMIHEGEEGF